MTNQIEVNKYEGHTPADAWRHADGSVNYNPPMNNTADVELIADAPLLLAEVKRLREGIRSILSDYDITELIRDVPEDEWNFEQQALIRMKEMIE